MTDTEILTMIRERLSSRFEIEQMFLCGSRASGRDRPDSDWDVLVVAQSKIPFVERQGVTMESLGPHDCPIDLLLYTPDEAAHASEILGSAVYWAQREGRLIYAM